MSDAPEKQTAAVDGTETRERLFVFPLWDRLSIAWRLLLDALLIGLAVALRAGALYLIDTWGGEDWSIRVVRFVADFGFVAASLIVTGKDVLEFAVDAYRAVKKSLKGGAS